MVAASLYRAILREARQLPTLNRRFFVEQKARVEFRAAVTASGPDLDFKLQLAAVRASLVQV
jgi:hypothetical protein